MSSFDDFKLYLPKYLTPESQKLLFKDLEDFPNNLGRIYSDSLSGESDVLQGDGIRQMPIVSLPDTGVLTGPVMMLSNTCDVSFENTKRITSSQLIYCPIVKLSKYKQILIDNSIDEKAVDSHIEAIRKQFSTSRFFLPHGAGLPEDCVALLDKINSCDLAYISRETVIQQRVFSLSNYGFYIFLFKLSIHFTRVMENVERN